MLVKLRGLYSCSPVLLNHYNIQTPYVYSSLLEPKRNLSVATLLEPVSFYEEEIFSISFICSS